MSVESQIQSKVNFSVVIPVFNEEGNLEPLYTRLTKVMKDLGEPYEVIFVDDGSTDGSFQILKGLHEKDKNIKVIRFTRNFGQHPAIMAGFNASKGEIIITLDADLQNPPEEIPKLIDKLDDGYEVVFGVFQRRKHSVFRRAGSSFAKWVLGRILPVEATDLSAFRALRSYTVAQLKLLNEKSKFLDGLLCWMGYKVGKVEVAHEERHSGKTKYTPFKLLSLWLDMIVSFTELPLKIAIFSGLFLGVVGLALALFYLIRYFLYGFGVPGFATIVILITFFSGVQLFALGILGEYVGRMNKEVKNKPEYIVRGGCGYQELDGEKKMRKAKAGWTAPEFNDMGMTQWGWRVTHRDNFKLGENVEIGSFTMIDARNGVTIEDDVKIGFGCVILSHSSIDNKSGRVILRRQCKIGANSVVMPGVEVGEGAIVGSNSFVNRNIPPHGVWFGTPARFCRRSADPQSKDGR